MEVVDVTPCCFVGIFCRGDFLPPSSGYREKLSGNNCWAFIDRWQWLRMWATEMNSCFRMAVTKKYVSKLYRVTCE